MAVHTIADHLTLWLAEDCGSIHIKTREPHGDPVELDEGDVAHLIALLKEMIGKIDGRALPPV